MLRASGRIRASVRMLLDGDSSGIYLVGGGESCVVNVVFIDH